MPITVYGDDYFMKQALIEAQKAFDEGEIPVGAVIVSNNQIIARAHNQTEILTDVTAHAEIIAITAASSHLGAKFLEECTLYVTLEPCVMCAGALNWARLSKVVYGAADDARGFMRYGKEILHHKTKLEYGVLHDDCQEIVTRFFKELREETF